MEAFILFHVRLLRHCSPDHAFRRHSSIQGADLLDTKRRKLLLAVEILHGWVLGGLATFHATLVVQLLQGRALVIPSVDDLQHGGTLGLCLCRAHGWSSVFCRQLGICL